MPALFSIAPRLMRLAWPVAIARLGIMGMGLVDVIVVGQLVPRELPHQALGWAPTGVFLVTGIGLLTGVQVLAARAIGAGEPENAGGAWRRGLIVAAVGGAIAGALMWAGGARLFTVFGVAPGLAEPSAAVMRILALSVPLHLAYVATSFFLEAVQRPMASMVVMWAANIVNLVLNLLLVPDYGAIGSAWSTVGARFFLCGALIIWVLTMKSGTRYGVCARARAPSFAALLGVGAAAAVSQAAEAGAFSGMTIIAARIGESAVAAYQILLNLLAVVFMIALGLAAATAVLTSEAIGRKAPRDAALASWTGLALNTLCMLAVSVAVLVFARSIARAYTADPGLVMLIAGLMPLAAAVLAPDGGQVVAAAALRARGDNWFPTASHILAYALVMPVLGFAWAEAGGSGVAGLMYAIFWSSVLSVGVLCARLWWLGRRKTAVGSRQSAVVKERDQALE